MADNFLKRGNVMSIFRSFFRKSSPEKRMQAETEVESNNDSTSKETADNPVLFADWVCNYIVLRNTFEEDMQYAPPGDFCKKYSITDEVRRFCANEYSLGACLFVRNNLDEKYYLKFRENLMPLVIERMKRNAPDVHCDEVSWALERYLEDLKSDSHTGFSLTFLERAFPNVNCTEQMFVAGLPVKLGFQHVLDYFEHVRNGYCLLKFSMKYEELEKLQETMEKQ